MTLAHVDSDDALPSVFTPPQRQDTDSWVRVVSDVIRLAEHVAATEFVPKGLRNNVPATAAAMLYGREIGVPPMTALTSIHVVDGRPGLSAEGMRSLVYAAGHELVFDEATGAICRMRARRRGSSAWTELSWTLDMARAAGLLGGKRENWTKYPRAMLIARCTTDLCRMIFPDVIHGFRSVEEIADMGGDVDTSETAPVAPPRKVSRRRKPVAQVELPEPKPDEPDDPPPAESPEPPPPPAPPLPGEEEPSSTRVPPPSRTRPDAGEEGPRLVNRATLRMIFGQLTRLGVDTSDDDEVARATRLELLAAVAGRDELDTANDLTQDEATKVATMLASARDLDQLNALVDAANSLDAETTVEETTAKPEPEAEP